MPGQVKAIIPPKFQSKAVMQTLQTEMEKFAPFLVKAFERPVSSWSGEKPKFTPVKIQKPGYIAVQIRVLGPKKGRDKWKWLDLGTKPHKIRPRRAKRLRFQSGYNAGSKPGTTYTSRGSSFGDTVYARGVNHPGNEARGWTELIIKDNQKPFESWMKAAMHQAARASGHGV